MLRAEWGDMKLWWGGASGRGRRTYGAHTTALRKKENKSPGRSRAPAGIQPPIKITRPVPFRLVQPVTGSYQTGNLSRSLISALFLQQFCRKKAARTPSFLPHEHPHQRRTEAARALYVRSHNCCTDAICSSLMWAFAVCRKLFASSAPPLWYMIKIISIFSSLSYGARFIASSTARCAD